MENQPNQNYPEEIAGFIKPNPDDDPSVLSHSELHRAEIDAITQVQTALGTTDNTESIFNRIDGNLLTEEQKVKLQNTSGVNTGDQESSDFDHNELVNTHNLTTDIDHNTLTNYSADQHREISDSEATTTNLWSGSKINTELSGKENSLGNPDTDDMVLSSKTNGTRSWTTAGAGDMTKAVYDPSQVEEQLVGLTAEQSLSNKTLTSPLFTRDIQGSNITISDNGKTTINLDNPSGWSGNLTTADVSAPDNNFGLRQHVYGDNEGGVNFLTEVTENAWTDSLYTLNINSGGNVGIGIYNPAYRLDVDGDVNIPEGSNYKIGGVNIIQLTKANLADATLIEDTTNTNSYEGTFAEALTSYETGLIVNLKATNGNTGASTLNIDSLGVKSIKKNVSDDLSSGDIKAGQIVPLVYDGTNWQIVGGGGGTSLEKASGSDINTGTDDSKFVTSKAIADSWIETGWIPARETWEYASVDNPTGVFTISGDVSSKYSTGMRLKMTNGGNTIYGIITAVSYSSPNTSITFLHEINPSNSQALYLMANSAITANYYSTQKVPFGFPLNPSKWTVKFTKNTNTLVSAPDTSTYYMGDTYNLSVPIGLWNLGYNILFQVSTTDKVYASITLSTSSSTPTDGELSFSFALPANGSTNIQSEKRKIVSLTTKTTYYAIFRNTSTYSNLYFVGNETMTSLISAVCAYL